MKRSAMPPRKKPMTRSRMKPSTKPLRNRTPKRAAQDRRAKPSIELFKREHPCCWNCGRSYGVELHHIARRAHKWMDDRRNWSALCERCHTAHHANEVSFLRVVALKSVFDGAWFDLAFIALLWGKGPEWMTEEDVLAEVNQLNLERSVPWRRP